VASYDTIGTAELAAMRVAASAAELERLVVVVPVADASELMVDELARSLSNQVYDRWEAVFVGDAGDTTRFAKVIAKAVSRDPRFRLPGGVPMSLSHAWNAALESAEGDLVVLADPRVSLRPHALFVLARTIARHPEAVLVYADDDAMDELGSRFDHYFKPDWNEALLHSQNYFGGVVCFRRSRALEVGGCEAELDGDCTWGLFMRMGAGAPPEAVSHVPVILSHRRSKRLADSVLSDARRVEIARAHERRLARIGLNVRVRPVGRSSYRIRHEMPDTRPLLSVIVPSRCDVAVLRPCIDGLLHRTAYRPLEIVVVANGLPPNAPERVEYLDALASKPEVRVLFYDGGPYNFSTTNNWASEQARGELFCFLNDDTEVIGPDWLSELVARILQQRVAAVGGLLVYPNGRIQHAGVVLSPGHVGERLYTRRRRDTGGYHDRALVDQDLSCVTAACMLVRRDVFVELGGFDEALAIAFNDVDFCLRLRRAGWRIVWTPSAELYHNESASIGRHDARKRAKEWTLALDLMRSRWNDELREDPHYNPNLSLDSLHLWEPAFPPRAASAWTSLTGSLAAGALP
jgi:GT2 family glycosyltransferase